MIADDFVPPWWLKNPHLQTLWASLCRPHPKPHYHRQQLELTDGDFLELDWSQNPGPDTPLVVILHGLEGSSRSGYVRALVQHLSGLGWQCLVMHFRGCGGTPNRLLRTYHSGETQDLNTVIRWLRQAWPRRPLAVVGYSLGANVLLKWLGEQQQRAPVQAAVAVCPPLCLDLCARCLERVFSRVYQAALMHALKRKMVQKYRHRSAPLDWGRVLRAKTFFEFDDAVTAPLHGFTGAGDYYRRSSSRPYLGSIRKPVLILSSRDDPFMTAALLPAEDELAPGTMLEITRHGGHVGFIAARGAFGYAYWLEQRISGYLREYLIPATGPCNSTSL